MFLGLGALCAQAQAQVQTQQAPLADMEPKAQEGENNPPLQEEAFGQLKLSTQTFTQTFQLAHALGDEANALLPQQPKEKTGRLLNLELGGDNLVNPHNAPWSRVDGLPLRKREEKKLLPVEWTHMSWAYTPWEHMPWVHMPWSHTPVLFLPHPSHVNTWPHLSRSRFHAYDNVWMRGHAEFVLAASIVSAVYQMMHGPEGKER